MLLPPAGVERLLPSDQIKPSDQLKIASWNVNSIKVRAEQVIAWLKSSETDILFMQETKSVDENFPAALFEAAGYHIHCHGQKTYNGVAVATRVELDDVRTGLPMLADSMDDEQARYIEVDCSGMTMAGLYMVEDAVKRLSGLLRSSPGWSTLSSFMPEGLATPLDHRSAMASHFTASLELVRDGELKLRQETSFGPIWLARNSKV